MLIMMEYALSFASMCLYFPVLFIHHHNGINISVRTALSGLLFYFLFIFTDYYTSVNTLNIDQVKFLLLCSFCLMFFLLDVSNKWLPFEFTLPFCILGLLTHLHDGNGCASIAALFSMLIFLLLLRLALNTLYHTESLGKGDVWLMAGIAAWSGFIYAAAIMAVSLLTLLVASTLKPVVSKKPSSSFYNGQVSLPLAPAICGCFIMTTVFNVPFISHLAF